VIKHFTARKTPQNTSLPPRTEPRYAKTATKKRVERGGGKFLRIYLLLGLGHAYDLTNTFHLWRVAIMDTEQPAASSQQPAASSQQPAASSQQPAASSQHALNTFGTPLTSVALFVLGAFSIVAINSYQRIKVVEERIYLDKPEVVLVDLKQFDNVRFGVKLINGTLHPITIINISSSCACSVPEIEKKELQPSETTDINVLFKVGMLQGNVEKRIEVICKYKERSLAVPLVLKASILPNLKIDKKSIAFDDNTNSVTFHIEPGVMGLDCIVGVESTAEFVKVQKNSTPGDYTVTVESGVKPSDIRGHTIVVHTTESPTCWPRIPLLFAEEASEVR
jgi:hypothetical protein